MTNFNTKKNILRTILISDIFNLIGIAVIVHLKFLINKAYTYNVQWKFDQTVEIKLKESYFLFFIE